MNLGVDIGGTFTDLAAFDQASGELRVAKSLNRGADPEGGLGDSLSVAGIAVESVEELTHGTTLVTNLLVEGRGAKVGLICSRGFRDVLEIQLSYRRRSFDLAYAKTPPIVPRHLRLEIGGRIDARGVEQEALDELEVEQVLRDLLAEGVESIAVSLYNAYANPAHERAVAEIAFRVAPAVPLTLATAVDARIGEYERVSTAVLNAAAVPSMERYSTGLERAFPGPICYMHSAGGVVPAAEARARPVQLAFSGPAAGVLAGRQVARLLGYGNAITMDMGGTTCDVCLVWEGELRSRDRFEVAWGVPARVRSLAIHSVGAGGGSIAWRDEGGALRVGPRSAGAAPGPACYGLGGTEPTVTDANLVLGILSPAGLIGGELPLDADVAEVALAGLAREFEVDPEQAASAVWAMVNATMAQAIREITVRQGLDPRSCLLVAFGGAGPQHAAGVAAELGVPVVAVPSNASVLSALGLLAADLEATAAHTVLAPLERLQSPELEKIFATAEEEAAVRLHAEAGDDLVAERFAGLRYVGQSHEVAIPFQGDPAVVAERFAREHERLYGTRLDDAIEVVDVWVTLTRARRLAPAIVKEARSGGSNAPGERHLRLVDAVVPVYSRAALDGSFDGPCLVEEPNSVTLVPAGARVRTEQGQLVVELS